MNTRSFCTSDVTAERIGLKNMAGTTDRRKTRTYVPLALHIRLLHLETQRSAALRNIILLYECFRLGLFFSLLNLARIHSVYNRSGISYSRAYTEIL